MNQLENKSFNALAVKRIYSDADNEFNICSAPVEQRLYKLSLKDSYF